MNDRSPEMLKPTLIAGIVFGIPAAIPFINILNVCTCCGFIWGCGFLASFLYSKSCRSAGVEFRPGSGAMVGLIAGAFYAVVSTVLGGLISLVMPQQDYDQILDQLESQGGLSPEALDFAYDAVAFLEETGSFVLIVIGFFFTVLIAAVFSTLGGLIGGAVFKVEPPPPAPGTTPGPPAPPSSQG
jgi:hypothetical protein